MAIRTFLFASTLLLSGCIQTLAVRTVGGILEGGMDAFYEESDLGLAQEGLGANLKLLEALIRADPDNDGLLLLAAQGYSAYALGFAEDDSIERARVIYRRARDYALRAIEVRFDADLQELDLERLRETLQGMSREDDAYVFWAGFSWGSFINVSRDNVSAMADISRVDALMEHILRNNREFYYSGADLYFGAMKASVPAVLGGKPEEAKEHFERAIAASGGTFLMAYVLYAQTYCTQTLNEELFDELLAKVEAMPLDEAPGIRLPNAIAKKKARMLRESKEELF